MPVIGENNYAQFVGALNSYQGQARQFALGLEQLKQAKVEFDARLKFMREGQEFERQKWQAESALNAVKLQAAQAELDAFRTKQQEDQAGREEFTAFNKELYLPYLDAVRTGTPEQIQAAQARMNRGLATMSMPGQRAFLTFQQQAVENQWLEPKIQSEIARNLGSAGGNRAVVKPDEVAKFLSANQEILTTTALGYNPKDKLADLDKQEKDLTEQQEPLKRSFQAALSSSQIISQDAVNAAVAGNLSGGGGANLMSVLNQAIGKSSGALRSQLEGYQQQIGQWRSQMAAVQRQRTTTLQHKQLAETFNAFSMNELASAAVVGDPEAAAGMGKRAATVLAPYGEAVSAAYDTPEYAMLGNTTDDGKRASLLSSLRQKILNTVPDQTGKAGLHASLVDDIIRAIDANTKSYIPVAAPVANNSKLGGE